MAKLPEAFASPPGRPGKYVLYISRRGDTSGLCDSISIWAAEYAAQKYMQALVADDGYVFETRSLMRTESGIVIQSKATLLRPEFKFTLDELWEREQSLAEMAWDLPHPYPQEIARVRAGRAVRLADAVLPERKEKRRGTHRAPRDGMIAAAELAVEFGLCARELRGALRKAKIPKPSAGWAWAPSEIENTRALIRKVLGR